MAFVSGVYDHKDRFSLLLLEPGEIYFQDFSAFYYPIQDATEDEAYDRRQRGRLKLCSNSVVYVPNDAKFPIFKMVFRDIKDIEPWKSSLSSKFGEGDKLFRVVTNQVVYMKEHNIMAPYIFKRVEVTCVFGLVYGNVDDCVPHMLQLQRASTLPAGDQTAMINAIVMSRQLRVKFDTSWLEDFHETIVMETQGDKIAPLITNPGRIMLTSVRLYFQSFNNMGPAPVEKIRLSSICKLMKRRFVLRQVGIELWCRNGDHIYLRVSDPVTRDTLVEHILNQKGVKLDDLGQENMTLKWQNKEISNFEYLSYLNSMADRSINDLTQYPVFPWVIEDYTSSELDLTDPVIYRDLSKPIGTLTDQRLERLLERYEEMPEPRFLYGSHYSTPGYVLFYLARAAPEYMLCLQNGKFDHPDRMFNSISEAWNNCLYSMSDFKELIPEFFENDGKFLKNTQMIQFGTRHDGTLVGDVELPPWAQDAGDFIRQQRAALESEYVSEHLHEWIDLIFGIKQRGPEAESAHNVFYHLTYEGAIDLDSITDLNERSALETQIMEFGQTPRQLFKRPHPARYSTPTSPLQINCSLPQPLKQEVESKTNSYGDVDHGVVTNAWQRVCDLEPYHLRDLHKQPVMDIKWCSEDKNLISVSLDGIMKMYSVEKKRQLRSVTLSHMALSSCVVQDEGATVIAGSWDNSIYMYSLEYGRILTSTPAHEDAVCALVYHNGLLASASWDSVLKLWKCPTGNSRSSVQIQPLAEFEHDSGLTSVSVHPHGNLIATGTREGQMCLWDINTHQSKMQQQAHLGEVQAIMFSPDGERLLTSGADQSLRVIDVNTGTELLTKHLSVDVTCGVWCSERRLVGGDSAGQLHIWDMVQMHQLSTQNTHRGPVRCVAASETGQLASGGDDCTIQVWNASSTL